MIHKKGRSTERPLCLLLLMLLHLGVHLRQQDPSVQPHGTSSDDSR